LWTEHVTGIRDTVNAYKIVGQLGNISIYCEVILKLKLEEEMRKGYVGFYLTIVVSTFM
jgi:hypothetical protein